MAASLIDHLQERVQRACSELVSLKKEREGLLAEVELMREESRRARRLLREHQELLQERKKFKDRLESLYEKLERSKI